MVTSHPSIGLTVIFQRGATAAIRTSRSNMSDGSEDRRTTRSSSKAGMASQETLARRYVGSGRVMTEHLQL